MAGKEDKVRSVWLRHPIPAEKVTKEGKQLTQHKYSRRGIEQVSLLEEVLEEGSEEEPKYPKLDCSELEGDGMKMLPAAARWRHYHPRKAFSERRRPSARSFKRLRIPNELPASTARAGQGARVENSTNSFPRVAAPHLLLVSAGKPAGEHHRPAAHSLFLESCCSWFQRVTKWKPGWLSSEMTKVVTSKNSALSSCT